MKNELFASMKAQMTPSPAASAALTARLAETAPVAAIPWGRYAAVAACAALAIAAFPVYNALKPAPAVHPLHSYVTVTGEGESKNQEITAVDVNAGGMTTSESGSAGDMEGDHDVVMSAGELGEEMEKRGFPLEDAETFWAEGYRMTWALWWNYDGGASLEELEAYAQANQEWIDAIISDYGVPGETAPNTGEVYSGAFVDEDVTAPDSSAQEAAANAYQTLMDTFRKEYGEDGYPDWYGGAYLQGRMLVVCVVEGSPGTEDGSKDLYLKIIDMAGGSSAVGFSDCKYSLNHLCQLQRSVEALPELSVSPSWGCGVDDALNKVVLDVTAADDALLSALAELDPADDAIEVRVLEGAILFAEDGRGKAPAVVPGGADKVGAVDTVDEYDSGGPAAQFAIAGDEGTDDLEDLIADEPWVDGPGE